MVDVKMKYDFKAVEPGMVELSPPLECPSCQGHFKLDSTWIEQEEPVSCACPICGFRANIPEEV